MLEEAIIQASDNFINRLRATYEEAEILSAGLRTTEQQVAGLLDQQVTDVMAPYSVINMPAYPPLLKWQYAVPECLRSVKEQADHMAMELAEQTGMSRLAEHMARQLAEPTARELAEQTAAELAEPPWATLRLL